MQGEIRAGIGGWTYAPWRGVFYPAGLPHAGELAYASRQLSTIEINGTFYRTQSPQTFAKWARETPDHFVFSVKAPRYAVHRRVLGDAGESIERFFKSGPAELGDKLGPILWQFAPTKKFDADDFAAFLKILPEKIGGRALRHALEVRHPSFAQPTFIALARKHRAAIVFADHPTYPAIADATGDFVYARLQKGHDDLATGYPRSEIKDWVAHARVWAKGQLPGGLPVVAPRLRAAKTSRDVFVYFIHNGKVRAPAAAMEFLKLVDRETNQRVKPERRVGAL